VRLSVVIPALDEAGAIADAVRSAAAGGRAEVIVVDGGSADDTPERAARAGARVLRAPAGRARQLAAGVAAAGGEAVVLLHADSRLPAGWEGAVAAALADPRVAGGCFRFRFAAPRTPALALVEWGVRLRVALLGLPYGDQGIFARRSVLERIGGVPQAPIMEDLDLVRSLRREGRLVRLALPVETSARRYRVRGTLRTVVRNALALCAWRLGLDRERVAAWYRR
jgi:rSAM/selenodomain-associated transferase 2